MQISIEEEPRKIKVIYGIPWYHCGGGAGTILSYLCVTSKNICLKGVLSLGIVTVIFIKDMKINRKAQTGLQS